MDRERLSAGRVAARTYLYHQLRGTPRQIHRLYQREPGKPASEYRMAGTTGHHRSRRLFALPLSAALRTGWWQGHRPILEYDLPGGIPHSRFTARGTCELLRSRGATENQP